MAADALRSLWAEPRPGDALGPTRRDWILVALLAAWALAEAAFRHDLLPLPLLLVAAVAVVAPLPWRRSHPLLTTIVAFGTSAVVDVVRLVADLSGSTSNVTVVTLLLTFSLARWGSGREVAAGLGVVAIWLSLTLVLEATMAVEAVAGFAFFLSAATLGVAIRFRSRIRARDLDRAKAQERVLLARELHDTVAHHVSGIAIQAQAGRAVAATDPARAVEALAVIEESATRTLAEMRSIVGVLRAPQTDELAPQPDIADVERLATDPRERPAVEVVLSGRLDDLAPSTGAAIYRLAQESVTNARRHARHATRVTVAVIGDAEHVRLTVDDDGSATGGHDPGGYGLVGMRERASLLGGTFHAGPTDHGWQVEAVLPRAGAPR